MEPGALDGAWGWGAENTQGRVHGPTGSERARSSSQPHTPTHCPGEDNGCLCPASRIHGAGPGTSWLLSSCASHQPFPRPARLFQSPAPGNFSQPNPGPEPSSASGAGDWGALTTVLLRWLWTVKSGQKRRSAMARSKDSARGRAFSSSSSPCLGHSIWAASVVAGQGEVAPGFGGWKAVGICAQAGEMKEEAEEKGSRFPITSNLLRQKGARAGAGLGPWGRGNLPTDWEEPGQAPKTLEPQACWVSLGSRPWPGRGQTGRASAQLPCPHICPASGVEPPVGEAPSSAAPPSHLHLYSPSPTRDLEEYNQPQVGSLPVTPSPPIQPHSQAHRPLLALPRALWTRRSPSSQGPQRCRAAHG